MRKRILSHLMALTVLSAPLHAAPIEQSVVKIVNQSNQFNWYTPWASGNTGKGTGSGFVISGNRILTNAHVVKDAALLLLYFHNDPTPYPATVTAVGHDCDLALIELKDPSIMQQIPALEFDGLPALRSQVVTYGYPAGGQLISSTAGVVSRIEMQNYVHSGVDRHLAGQTDAAINPGNSGGPVIQNGKVVGVAFQGNSQLQNMGFFIPTCVVNHFLDDLKDGHYHGFPELGIIFAPLENPAARAYSGLTDDQSGVRIEWISKKSSADEKLQVGDIITHMAGYDIANDGTIDWNGLRIEALITVDVLQMGDILPLTIVRQGKTIDLQLRLNDYNPTPRLANLYDQAPQYVVQAGLVFVPLNRETLKSYGNNWQNEIPQELMYEFFFKPLIEDSLFDEPRVIQIRRLDHEVNIEESCFLYRIVESINHQPISTLQDVINAFENNNAPEHIVQYKYGNYITVLDRKMAETAHGEILTQYTIPKDRNL
jgi:S1-C subfamily serine protease